MTAISPSQLWKKRLGDWVINPFVGCEHGCKHCYCPNMPGVKFFNERRRPDQWGKYLLPKENIVATLEHQLKRFTPDKSWRTAWGDGWILMSFLTDCYTPAEGKLKLTRQCVQRILEAGHRLRIQTRSAMVERDFDILRAHPGQVLLGTSLPHLDDALARVLEQRATGPTRRLKMLEKAAAAGIPIYCAMAPIYPFHDVSVLAEVAARTAHLPLREIFCEVLNVEGGNLERMSAALSDQFPEHVSKLRDYPGRRWAEFTFEVLQYGYRSIRRFVPWPDTGCRWKPHLPPAQAEFLSRFIPKEDQV